MPDIHPFAKLFQPIEGDAFDALVADIKANGLHNCITLYDGQVLDGQNRLRACEVAGVEPQFDRYDGDDPLGFVLSMNVARRHLDDSQRALIAAKIANMRQGERTDLEPSANLPKVSQAEAAKRLDVSVRSLGDAKVVLKTGDTELIASVEKGVIPVSRAVETARRVAEPVPLTFEDSKRIAAADREKALKESDRYRERREAALAAMTPAVDEAAIEAWLKTAMDSQRGNISIKAHNAIASKEERWRVIEALTGAKVTNRDDPDGPICEYPQ